MDEITLHRRSDDREIDYLEDEELDAFLELAAQYIGRIIIEFNSIEESIAFCAKEIVSSSESGDDQIYVFLAEMGYSSKVTALINLYGQIIEACELKSVEVQLSILEQQLRECAKRRNQYAHGYWSEITKSQYVHVKTKALKKGVFHTYRKFDENEMKADLEFIESAHELLEEFDEKFNDVLLSSIPR